MRPHFITESLLKRFINNALEEDIGIGDFSSLAGVPSESTAQAQMLAKADGLVAGVELACSIFKQVDESLEIEVLICDGGKISIGDKILIVKGKAQSILSSERLVLNCAQRMSGIASYTAYLNSLIAHTNAKLLDTRKTTPGFRAFEKWAVRIGGGQNHRMGLYDMIMLKDNHIDFAGGIPQAITRTHDYLKANALEIKIEIETRNLDEVRQVLEVGGVDYIMLDNMDTATMKQAIQMIDKRFYTEASGNISEKNIAEVAQTGVDFISVGALTHSYKSIDLSLKAVKI